MSEEKVIPIRRASKSAERRAPSLGAIALGVNLSRNVDEAVDALVAGEGNLYTRSGALVRVVRDGSAPAGFRRAAGALSIRPYAGPTMLEILSRVAAWERFDKRSGDWTRCLPSAAVVSAVLARGEWSDVSPLVGILEAPSIRPDGTIIQAAGYDAATGYLYAPTADYPPVPELPTQEDAARAVAELLEVVADFPFATSAHRSGWLAFLLTLLARPAIDGCTPLFVVDATTPGTGKGKLVDATAIIATGREATKTPLPQDDEECRKRLTAIVVEGERLAVIDNVASAVCLPSLDAMLTSTTWKDRILGRTETVTAPNLTVVAATGNNMQLAADTARRSNHIRLESPLERPEERADFAHADLLAWVREERARLVVAALTILRAYFVAGQPDVGCKPWGSFEAWARLMPSALVWCGQADPMAARLDLSAAVDSTRNALVALITSWPRLAPDGITAKGAIDALYPTRRDPGPPDGFDDLRDAIEQIAPPPPGKAPTAQKLGYALRRYRRRVVGGRMLDCTTDRKGIAKWAVAGAQGAGDAGDEGDVSSLRAQEGKVCISESPEGNIPSNAQHPRQADGDAPELFGEWVERQEGRPEFP